MRIFIEPTEPLMFRSGRPFSAGENNFAESIFPPTPETLQGALRAMIAVQWGQQRGFPDSSLSDLFGQDGLTGLIGKRTETGDTYGRFRITGLTLGRRIRDVKQSERDDDINKIERLFPAPASILRATLKNGHEADETFQQLVTLRPQEQPSGVTNMPAECGHIILPNLNGYKTAGKSAPLNQWLTPAGLGAVLQGGIPTEKQLVEVAQIYTFEPRLGIGMDNAKKTTKERYLYQVVMVRMQQHCGFVVDIEFGEEPHGKSEIPPLKEERSDGAQDVSFLTSGWMTLGGEQRAAHFTVLAAKDCVDEPGIATNASGNMVYFASPAFFKGGWLPEDATLFPAPPITAALNRYQSIGGWYLTTKDAGGGNKVMRRCIPAGSVYFFSREQRIAVQRSLTEYGWQIGYGITYTGEWK